VSSEYNKIMEILLDASAIMAVIADEPESETVINYTRYYNSFS
jgi:predicted nucleic acid-binding protein